MQDTARKTSPDVDELLNTVDLALKRRKAAAEKVDVAAYHRWEALREACISILRAEMIPTNG